MEFPREDFFVFVFVGKRGQVFFGKRQVRVLIVAPAFRDLKPFEQTFGENQFKNLFSARVIYVKIV